MSFGYELKSISDQMRAIGVKNYNMRLLQLEEETKLAATLPVFYDFYFCTTAAEATAANFTPNETLGF